MSDAMNGAPPAVVAAAKIVQDFLDQKQRERLAQDAPPPMSAAERYRLRNYDQTQSMPAWQDSRKG
jgi:hypothetical protein